MIGNLNAVDMLNVWEQGLNQSPLHRALILLAVAQPNSKVEDLTQLSIGQRDKHLLLLRERLFGSRLLNTATCPKCSERIEWQNKVADIIASPNKELGVVEFEMDADDYHIRFRLPNSQDIDAAMVFADEDKARDELLKRCVVAIECGAKSKRNSKRLPAAVIDALEKRIEELDPQAQISINLQCPECSHDWNVLFDITNFLWSELNDWAERTLQLIHKLASAYGWTEKQILDLSPVRRQLYSGMVGQ